MRGKGSSRLVYIYLYLKIHNSFFSLLHFIEEGTKGEGDVGIFV